MAVPGGKSHSRLLVQWVLAEAIRMKETFPGQMRNIEENRSFFARIVEQNREWRPDKYREWVRKRWID